MEISCSTCADRAVCGKYTVERKPCNQYIRMPGCYNCRRARICKASSIGTWCPHHQMNASHDR